jgi:hypothetical protein
MNGIYRGSVAPATENSLNGTKKIASLFCMIFFGETKVCAHAIAFSVPSLYEKNIVLALAFFGVWFNVVLLAMRCAVHRGKNT